MLERFIMSAQQIPGSGSAPYIDRAEITWNFVNLFAKTQLLQKEILFLVGLIILVASGGWAIFMHIDSSINELKQNIHNLSIEMATIKTDIACIKEDISELREDIKELQGNIAEIKEGR